MKLSLRYLCLLLAVLLPFTLLLACSSRTENPPAGADTQPVDYTENVMVSQNYHLSLGMAYYYFDSYYQSLQKYYGSYFQSITGIDPAKSLRSQTMEDGSTAFEYLLQGLIWPNLLELLCLNEAAQAADFILSEDQQAAVRREAEAVDLSGKDWIDTESLVYFNALTTRAGLYQEHLQNSYVYTDADFDAYAADQGTALQTAEYLYYTIQTSDLSDEQKSALTEQLDTLKTLHNCDAFTKSFTDILQQLYPILTAESISAALEKSRTLTTDSNSVTLLNTWSKSADLAPGDVTYYTNDAGTAITVACLLRAPFYDEQPTATVRHILARTETAGSAQAAHTTAQAWYDSWCATDRTEASFIAFAEKNSEDPGSVAAGGLYENIAPGQTVDAFDSWCFAPNRSPGDSGLVDTEYGTHVMYYCHQGLPRWKATALTQMRKRDFSAELTTFIERFTVKENETLLQNIEL